MKRRLSYFITLLIFIITVGCDSKPSYNAKGGGSSAASDKGATVDISSEARTALVIGVSKYADHYFNRLEAPEADAKAMEENLRELGFSVTLLLNPTRQAMYNATDTFGAKLAERKGVGLFYFSGHGSIKPDEADPNFLIPAGTNIGAREDLPQEAYNAQRVANRMKAAGNRLNLIFLDACRSNTLPGRTKDGAAGLAAMRGASGLMFFFATQPNEVALEDNETKQSLFTQALLKHIRTPGLEFMVMMGDVTEETEKLSASEGSTFKQSPFMSGTLSGRFAFVPAVVKPELPVVPVISPGPAAPVVPFVPAVVKPDLPVVSVIPPGPPVVNRGVPKADDLLTVKLPGQVALSFCYCPAGEFTMGSPEQKDQVKVKLSQGYWLAQTELTQGQWRAVMGTTLRQQEAKKTYSGDKVTGEGEEQPMYFVNHDEAREFCAKLNKLLAGQWPAGHQAMLPTEAQWEYAARAGYSTRILGVGDGKSLDKTDANFSPSTGTMKVKSFQPNAWGLYDMHGNVWEWCLDSWDGSNKLPGGTDPVGAERPSYRVYRGGGWYGSADSCEAGTRNRGERGLADNGLGFRLALSLASPSP